MCGQRIGRSKRGRERIEMSKDFWRGFWDGMGLGPLWRFLGGRAFRAGMLQAAQIVEQLRDEHCASTGNAFADRYACSAEGMDCDFVAAWNDAAAAIRDKAQ